MSEFALEIDGLCKAFGALIATDDITLRIRNGETHALIGPNGAGKTTLVGQLTGELTPDAGRILFGGRDITDLSTAQRARRGLARSFQITSIFDSCTAEDNVALAVQATEPHSFRFWRPANAIARLRQPARKLIADVGLDRLGQLMASRMSHGQHRQLELGMALATRPTMLLLDEPMAGLGIEETRAMAALLAGVKGRYTILLIEHDMDVVFSLADRISVLVGGRLIASGTADDIRNDPDVRRAYLGEEDNELQDDKQDDEQAQHRSEGAGHADG
jgi:branched-chain amino acid transport system ATP-binding protein